MEYYSAVKRNKILPFATAWTGLEGIMLSEINQSEKKIPYYVIYVWNLRKNINEQTKQKQNHRYKEDTDDCQSKRGLGD